MKITDSIYADAERIVEVTQKQAFYAVDRMLILRNWLLGRRIFEEELKGKGRAEYGAEVIIRLSKYLNEKYGRGFSKRYLWEYLRFYKAYPEIVQIPSAQFESTKETEIVQIASAQFKSLTWSHYRLLLQVSDKTAREWYEQETEKEMWSVKTLQRNISTQYYYRMLKSYDEEPVREEMKEFARYSILNGNEQLFASKYKLYLPTEEQLRAEIENQKQVFLAQQVEDENEIE